MASPTQPTRQLHSGASNLFGGSGGGGSGGGGGGGGSGGGGGGGGSGTGTGTGGSGTGGGSGGGSGTGTGGGSGPGGTCFVAGTPVATPAGDRRIEALRVGDRLVVWDAGRRTTRAVRAIHVGVARALIDLRTASATLVGVTPGHRVVDAATGGWRLAGDLKAGDRVWVHTPSGHRMEEVLEVAARLADEPVPVWNLSLDGDGAFHAAGVVVGQKLVAHAGVGRSLAAPLLGAALLFACANGDTTKGTSLTDVNLDRTETDSDADTDTDSDVDTDADTDVDAEHSAWIVC